MSDRRIEPAKALWRRVGQNLLLNQKTGVYYVRKQTLGRKPLFKSTGQTNKLAGQTRADEILREWLSHTFVAGRSIRFAEVCDELEQNLKAKFECGERRARTWEHDRGYLKLIKQYFGDRLIKDFTERSWEHWLTHEGRTLNRTLFDLAKYVSKVLTFAVSYGYIHRKPTIRNPDRIPKEVKIFENHEIEHLMAHAGPVLSDLILVAAETGLRPDENRNLRWDWIDFKSGCVTVHLPASFTKTKENRSIEVSDNVAQCLIRRRVGAPSPYVFPGCRNLDIPISRKHFSRLWHAMLKRAGSPPGFKFHWLRHSFFTKALLDAKLPIAEVAQYGGNSPAILMKKYVKNDPKRTRNVASAVRLLIVKSE